MFFYKTDVVFTDCQLKREGGKIYLEIIMCHLCDSNDMFCRICSFFNNERKKYLLYYC